MPEQPLVSVRIITYNQAPFVAQCLDSVLMQQTNFPFEILIGEDESTDGTREICQAYAEKYPEKIRLFLRSRKDVIYINGEPTNRYNFIETLKAARGKYIAICDGDDYWTHPEKLQRQVDFMEAHPDYTICHHGGQKWIEAENQFEPLPDQPETANLKDLLEENMITNCTCLYRNGIIKELPDWFYKAPVADYCLHVLNAQHGKIGYLPEDMCVYRVHGGGVWSKITIAQRAEKMLKFFELLKAERVLAPGLQAYLDQNIFLQHYRIAYGQPQHQGFYSHFRYCLMNAGTKGRSWVRVFNLLLVKLGLVRYEGGRFVFTFNQ
jgi:glycosyltransferase involved in cell wall biosynthesis